MIRASAPGKLMLAGEYIVASGHAPALGVAIGRRVTVTLEPGGETWRVTSPALGLASASPEEVPVVAELLARIPDLPAGGHLIIESELGAGPDKPGLGGSAAVCVAVNGALSALMGEDEVPLSRALDAHWDAQGGRGSGYDVAICHHGGVCQYDPTTQPPTVTAMPWPEGLHARVLFTGRGASTVALLGAVERFAGEVPDAHAIHMDRLSYRSNTLIEAWESSDIEAVLDAAAEAGEALIDFARDGGIPIEDGRHGDLLSVIEEAGAVGRTSGAGGGDCAWALSAERRVLEAAVDAAKAAGFLALDLELGVCGLEVTVEASTVEELLPDDLTLEEVPIVDLTPEVLVADGVISEAVGGE